MPTEAPERATDEERGGVEELDEAEPGASVRLPSLTEKSPTHVAGRSRPNRGLAVVTTVLCVYGLIYGFFVAVSLGVVAMLLSLLAWMFFVLAAFRLHRGHQFRLDEKGFWLQHVVPGLRYAYPLEKIVEFRTRTRRRSLDNTEYCSLEATLRDGTIVEITRDIGDRTEAEPLVSQLNATLHHHQSQRGYR